MKRHLKSFTILFLLAIFSLLFVSQSTAQDKVNPVVNGAMWNADESRILSWSADGTVRLWDAANSTSLFVLKHDGALNGAKWNADESRILSWSADGTVRLWDAANGTSLFVLKHDGAVNGAMWNADESRILSWSADGTVRLWDAANGDLLLMLQHDAGVDNAVLTSDGSLILSRSNSTVGECIDKHLCLYKIRMWNALTGANLFTIESPDISYISGMVLNQDETRLLSWVGGGWVSVWDTTNGTRLLNMRSVGEPDGAMWARDESKILSWGSTRLGCNQDCLHSVLVWNATTGDRLLSLRHDGIIAGAMWNQAETLILSWSGNGAVRVWDAMTKRDPVLIVRHDGSVNGAIWNKDESRILSWSVDGTLRIWDAADGNNLLMMSHKT